MGKLRTAALARAASGLFAALFAPDVMAACTRDPQPPKPTQPPGRRNGKRLARADEFRHRTVHSFLDNVLSGRPATATC